MDNRRLLLCFPLSGVNPNSMDLDFGYKLGDCSHQQQPYHSHTFSNINVANGNGHDSHGNGYSYNNNNGNKTHRYKISNCSESTRNQYQSSVLGLGLGLGSDRCEKKVSIEEQVRKIQLCLNYHMEMQYNNSRGSHKPRSLTQQKSTGTLTINNPNNLVCDSAIRLKVKSRRRINDKNMAGIHSSGGHKSQRKQLIQNMFKVGFKKKFYDESAEKIVQEQTRKLTMMAMGLQQFQKSKCKTHRQRLFIKKCKHKATVSQPVFQNNNNNNNSNSHSHSQSNLEQILQNSAESEVLALHSMGMGMENNRAIQIDKQNSMRFNQIISHINRRSQQKFMQVYRSQPISPNKSTNKLSIDLRINSNRTGCNNNNTSRTQKRLTKNQITLITRTIQNKLKQSNKRKYNASTIQCNNFTKIHKICQQIKMEQNNLNNYFKIIGGDVQLLKTTSISDSSNNSSNNSNNVMMKVNKNVGNICSINANANANTNVNLNEQFMYNTKQKQCHSNSNSNSNSNNVNNMDKTNEIPVNFLKKLKYYYTNTNTPNNQLAHQQRYQQQQGNAQEQYKHNRNKCMNIHHHNHNHNHNHKISSSAASSAVSSSAVCDSEIVHV